MIEFDKVARSFGKKVAVAGLDLNVQRGELFAFLGPNGAGKTTTIKMAVGLLRASSGAIRICGYDTVSQPREANQLLSYVPDEPYLYDKLTGREFLQFIADMYGLGRDRSAANIAREIKSFQLQDFIDDLSENYSHGMKQRTVFASAMLHDPAVLILDEPMVGLDPRSMRTVKNLLRAKADAGMTIFMSTHTLHLAEEIADRVGIVNHGRLMFLGSVRDLKNQLTRTHSSLEEFYLELTAGSADDADAAASFAQSEAAVDEAVEPQT